MQNLPKCFWGVFQGLLPAWRLPRKSLHLYLIKHHWHQQWRESCTVCKNYTTVKERFLENIMSTAKQLLQYLNYIFNQLNSGQAHETTNSFEWYDLPGNLS